MSQAAPHPTPSGDGELRAEIAAMFGCSSRDVRVGRIMQLIAQECAAARVDELKKIPIRSCPDDKDDTNVIWWHGYYPHEIQYRPPNYCPRCGADTYIRQRTEEDQP